MKLSDISLALASLAGMVSLCACDNIAEDDRYVPVPKPVIPVEEVAKVLLIQEFTGTSCPNCPAGAQTLHAIQNEYPGNVVVVGMHPMNSQFTVPKFGIDFRTNAAEAMFLHYNPVGFPTAVFNGATVSDTAGDWATIASRMVTEIANMSIKADCEYDADTRGLTVDYTINMTHDISNKDGYGIMVWIMENDIVGFQQDGALPKPNYVHNHVLRGSLNGDHGQVIGNAYKAGESYKGSASMTLDESWKAENCQVVVYMFDTETYEVEQTVVSNVISEKVVEDPHKVPQTLLIQEFTGTSCPNCPAGAQILHGIQNEYPGKVIVVWMHPMNSQFTMPKFGFDFRSEIAEAMFVHYNPVGFPTAIFNGAYASDTAGEWFTVATNEIKSETNMTINASTAFDPETREVEVTYYVDFTEDVKKDINIMVWIMENGIVGFQQDGSTPKIDYVHNHVLRGSMTGNWGENIGKEFANGETVKRTASMKMEEGWVADNCQVVVFTIDSESKAVLQATVANVNVPASKEEEAE